MTITSRATRRCAAVLLLIAGLTACGGGTGLGPGEIEKREDRLRDRLPIDWTEYNAGDFQGSIDSFTKTLEQADVIEGVEGVKNVVKAEAQNGVGWSYLRLHDLDAAVQAFSVASRLDRNNADVWVGWAGVALALQEYGDVLSFSNTALELEPDYASSARIDGDGRDYSHDDIDKRHVHLMLAEAYFQLGRYSAADRPDPQNAAAQVRIIKSDYRYRDPGQLLEAISQASIDLQEFISAG